MLGLAQVREANRKAKEDFFKVKQQRDARAAAKKAWKESKGEQ